MEKTKESIKNTIIGEMEGELKSI